MTRRFILFAGLVAAVAVAVLLRTASSQVDATVASAEPEREPPLTALLEVSDCTISTHRLAHLLSSDASQPAKKVPGDAAKLGVAHHANEQHAALMPETDYSAPILKQYALRPTIRPPPRLA